MWENQHQKNVFQDPFFTNDNNFISNKKPVDPFEDLFRTALNTPLSKIKKPENQKNSENVQKNNSNQNLFGSVESISSSKAAPLIPTRLAPLPPLPEPLKNIDEKIMDTKQSKTEDKLNNIVKCGYDFVPQTSDSNQVQIQEGESVEILQKHDDAGNFEWWLVKKANGKSGYVPASYLLIDTQH